MSLPFVLLLSAIVPQPQILTGFVENGAPGSYWTGGTAFTATIGGGGIELKRGARRFPIRFPGARLRWLPYGESQGAVHRIGAGTWRAYSSLRAAEALPGVDILLLETGGVLKSEFHLNPGIRPESVRYCFENARPRAGPGGLSLRIDPALSETGLKAWQTGEDGRRHPVDIRFRVRGSCVSFRARGVDPALATVIDPDYVFSTYLGGGLFEFVTSAISDASGNVFLGGWTESSDFLSLAPFQAASGGRIDGFIVKLSPTGQLLYATFLGGALEDRIQSIALDPAGNVVVAGYTSSTNFPLLAPAMGALAGGRDAFVSKLNPQGSALIFSTLLGGTSHDSAWSVAVDSNSVVAVAGETASANFPVFSPLQACGGNDGFIARFSTAGSLLSSTCIGGGGDDKIRSITFGPDNVLHATGGTTSSNFPVVNAPYPVLRGAMDAYYARFPNNMSGTLSSTYLGGSGGVTSAEESGYAVRVTENNVAWVAGSTPSADFPAASTGFQPVYGGGITDAFLAVFNGDTHVWSSYLGGSGIDGATALAGSPGAMAVAGFTTSANLPLQTPLQAVRGGEYDAFWAVFTHSSTTPLYLSYLGGAGADSAQAIASATGALTIAGSTLSTNFPLLNPVQSANPSSYGGFATRIRFGPAPVSVSPAAGSGSAGTFTVTYSDADGASVIQSVSLLFNNSVTSNSACYLTYSRSSNLFSLFQDHLNTWVTLAPGTGATVENNQCSITGTNLTATLSGQNLTLSVPVVFKTAFNGTKNIYAFAANNAGVGSGWPQLGTYTIVAAAAPVVNAASPAAGSGFAQPFAFNFTDANGGADIVSIQALFNTGPVSPGGCYLSYSRPAGTVVLWRESDNVWLPVTPGVAGVADNGRCSISGLGMSVGTTGNAVTLTVPVTFAQTFAGARTVYAQATDASGLSSGFVAAGSWTVPAQSTPSIAAYAPGTGSGPVTGAILTVSDANGATDLATVSLLVNASFSLANGCYLRYTRALNQLSLFVDSIQNWVSVTPGAAGAIENANCSVSGVTVAAGVNGNQLTLSVPITYKSGFSGPKTVWANAADVGGLSSGWLVVGSWTPSSANGPGIVSVTPATGAGGSAAFNLTVSDPAGADEIAAIALLVNGALSTSAGCYVVLDRAASAVHLYQDASQTWQTVLAGSARVIDNPQCSVSGAGVRHTGFGVSSTLTLTITFKPGFSGQKLVYAAAANASGQQSGWQQTGVWLP